MSDQYTEVTSQGYFQRLGGSIVGVLIGLLLFVGSIILLWWNEGRAVDAITALDQASKQVVEIKPDQVPDSANGHLVHVTGDMTAGQPAKDGFFGVTASATIRLKRTVEMYQWKEEEHDETHESVGGTKTTEKKYTYSKVWSETPLNSASYKLAEEHRNPAMPTRSQTFNAGDVKLGVSRVGPDVLSDLDAFKPFDLSATQPPADWQRNGDELYRGRDPSSPAIGDLRVHFSAVPAQTVSVLAALASGTLSEFHGLKDYPIALARPGVLSADQLISEKKSEENTLTWILRGVGFVLMLVSLLLIAGPVSTVLAFLPFLEGIAETGVFLVALTIAIPGTLLVIAFAWIAHRPLYGIGLIVAAVAAFLLFRRTHKRPVAVQPKPATTAFMPPGMTS